MASTNHPEIVFLGHIIWILVLTLLTLSYLTVGLRLWVRYRITRNTGWDDAAIVAALVSTRGSVDVSSEAHDCRCSSLVIAPFL
jgi:hypothetical protein